MQARIVAERNKTALDIKRNRTLYLISSYDETKNQKHQMFRQQVLARICDNIEEVIAVDPGGVVKLACARLKINRERGKAVGYTFEKGMCCYTAVEDAFQRRYHFYN